jgi:site-specific DNA-methyltransferase (adenine-specific)
VKPYYEQDGITIYHGDCRDVVGRLPPIGAVLTDPPYGHGKKWNGGTWATNPIYDLALKWDRETFVDPTLACIRELSSRAIIWGGNYYTLPPSRCWLAWEKTSKLPTMADFEMAWTSLDRPSKLFLEDRNPDGKREHPTEKPVSLLKWCLSQIGEAWTIGVVCDPFMGSGTTLRAAKDFGLRAIGLEIEERYCEIAAKRLSQGVLFPSTAQPIRTLL